MLLYFSPVQRGSLHNRYSGPYVVHKLINETGYVIATPDSVRKGRYCHINILKGSGDRLPTVPVLPVKIGSSSIPCDDARTADIKLTNSQILVRSECLKCTFRACCCYGHSYWPSPDSSRLKLSTAPRQPQASRADYVDTRYCLQIL